MLRFFARASQKRAELFIYDGIGRSWDGDGVTAKAVAQALDSFDGATELEVFINSPGGSVFDGLAIYNQLQRFKGKVITTVDGIAASIASIIMLAGSERRIASNALVMVHNPQTIVMGNRADLLKAADDLDRIRAGMLAVYTDRTGLKTDKIDALLAAETWLEAPEALAHGFVHEVIDSKAVEASFDLSKYDYKNAPARLLKAPAGVDARLARMAMTSERIKASRAGAATRA